MLHCLRACLSFLLVTAVPVAPAIGSPTVYAWRKVTDSAAFPGAYNFPVFTVGGAMWAFHPQGNWSSSDGRRWVRSPLPLSGLNSAYQKYVLLHDAVYALGTMTGNYLDLHLTSRIARTRNFRTWEVVSPESNLPMRVFYGAVTYRDRVWLLGGYDGHAYYNDVWTSTDAVHWTRVTANAGWSPRNVDLAVVFKDRMWIIGGGVIDGEREPNPNAKREAWSSTDGVHWEKAPDRTGPAWGGTPVVFDDQLWLVGANRNSTFAPASLVTGDGVTWREEQAPWPPRGAPAAWVFRDTLYLTGGKYSAMENGTPRFIYRNDVWQLTKVSGARSSNPPDAPASEASVRWPIPAGWKHETFELPPEFAPSLPYHGTEDLRFMPGFSSPTAPDYWSYDFVWWLDQPPPFDAASVAASLTTYYQGLTTAVGGSKYHLDPGRYHADLTAAPASAPPRLTGQVFTYDPFTTGLPITLNVEAELRSCPGTKQVAIVVVLSPKDTTDSVWTSLRATAGTLVCE